jgi:hypothetical protein
LDVQIGAFKLALNWFKLALNWRVQIQSMVLSKFKAWRSQNSKHGALKIQSMALSKFKAWRSRKPMVLASVLCFVNGVKGFWVPDIYSLGVFDELQVLYGSILA